MSDESHGNIARLIIDPPASGDWNMAVDELLLDRAADVSIGDALCLRFYQWSEATVSLGYFQSYAERKTHAASQACPVVRRLSGGGAIVHDRELTYSFVAPAAHRLAREATQLYDRVHATLIGALRSLGMVASLHGANDDAEPFLCFQRRTGPDVVVAGKKIAGSAQRRRRAAVLQHGSIILKASSAAPELPGLEEVAGQPVSADGLRDAWLPELTRGLGIEIRESPLTAAEAEQVEALRHDRYSTDAWNRRRP